MRAYDGEEEINVEKDPVNLRHRQDEEVSQRFATFGLL